jgi:hypothetical protein
MVAGRSSLVCNTVVLDAAIRPHDYSVEVAPKDRAEPDAGPFLDDHVPDKNCGRGDEGVGIDPGLFTVEREKVRHRCLPPP